MIHPSARVMGKVCTLALGLAAGPAVAAMTDAPAPATPSKIKVGNLRRGARPSLGHAVPAGRPPAGDRAARHHAHRRQGREAVGAHRRRAGGRRRGAGRPARRAAGARLRHSPASSISPTRSRATGGKNATAAARAKLVMERRQGPAGGREGDLPAGARGQERAPLRIAARLGEGRHAVHHHRRAQQPAQGGAEPGQRHRQGHPHQSRRHHARRQSETSRLGAGGLVDRPPQHAGRGAAARDGRALRGRARRAGRRRAEPAGEGQELRLADHHLWHRLLAAPRSARAHAKEGMEQPVYYWVPSIATSGLTFYTGDLFPDWKGNAFVGGLGGAQIQRLVFKGERGRRPRRRCWKTRASASATCARGPTARYGPSPTTPARCCASRRTSIETAMWPRNLTARGGSAQVRGKAPRLRSFAEAPMPVRAFAIEPPAPPAVPHHPARVPLPRLHLPDHQERRAMKRVGRIVRQWRRQVRTAGARRSPGPRRAPAPG